MINFLFIDEGFGILDIAITVLETLQLSEKTIGIISHVGSLQDQIGVQVEVEKRSGGYAKSFSGFKIRIAAMVLIQYINKFF